MPRSGDGKQFFSSLELYKDGYRPGKIAGYQYEISRNFPGLNKGNISYYKMSPNNKSSKKKRGSPINLKIGVDISKTSRYQGGEEDKNLLNVVGLRSKMKNSPDRRF